MKRILLSLGISLIFLGTSYGQSQIFIEDFESSGGYTTSITECTDNGSDYFIRTDGSNIAPSYSNIQDSNFFAAEDIDATGCPVAPSANATLTIDDIDISGFSSLEFRVYLATPSISSMDDADYFHITGDIDEGAPFNLVWVELDEDEVDGSNGVPEIDTDFNDEGDGTPLSTTFQQFTKSIVGTGSSLDLTLEFQYNSGGEGIAIDNIEIYGTASGGTPTKLAVTEVNGGSSPTLGTGFDVVVELQDADDNAVVASQDTSITLSVASGTGSIGGTFTGTVSSGSATATISGVTYDTAESGVTLTATNTGGSLTAGTSSSFEVLAAATKLIIKSFPSTGNTGVEINEFTVEVQRADDSVDLNSSASISLAINSGTGNLSGTTPVSATNGVATFSDISFDAADDFTVTASATGLSSATSGTITISTVVAPTAGTVFITEVSDADTDFNAEFIEFYNNGTSTVTLGTADLLMYDASGVTLQTTFDIENFTGSTLIPANGFLIIARGATEAEFETEWGTLEANTNFNEGSSSAFFGTGRRWVLKQGSTAIDSTSNGVGSNRDFQFPVGSGTFITGNQSEATPGLLDGQVELTSAAGYRLLSSPMSVSYSTLLDPIWTQGASTGADATNGDPNVFTWDNTSAGDANTNWDGLADLSGNVTSGEGFLAYVYADDDFNGSDDAFPKTLSVSGTPNAAGASPTINSNGDGWTLLGNPFAATIDFDNLTTNDITGTAYVWDPNDGAGDGGTDVNGGSGSWKTYNGATGDLTDGLITPFQGFFVQTVTTPTSASVAFPSAANSSGGTFYGKTTQAFSYLRLNVEGAEVSNSAWIQLSPNGSASTKVMGDAVELQPLSSKYAQLGFLKGEQVMDIAHVATSQDVTLPVEFNTTEGGAFTISATDFEIPGDMEVLFHDYQEELSVVIDGSFSYNFETEKLKKQDVPALSMLSAGAMQFKSTEVNRFGITIRPTSVNNETEDSPLAFALDQNYPNPFNPSTTISYSLEKASAVNISVYNLMGQKVATLVDENKAAGQYNVRWNAANVSSGMYYYRLEAGGQAITRKMTLIK